MGMSIKNAEVERLTEELSRAAGISKTEVLRQALQEKKQRLNLGIPQNRAERLRSFLESRVWPNLPAGTSRRWTKAEEERALGYGKHGEPR
jgi:hypothetical protein